MVSQPWAGVWSDRCTGRWGRRRPLILLGTAVNGLGLAGMAGADTLTEYMADFLVMDLGSNAAIGAYHGLWQDQAPAGQRGMLSGWVGFLSLLGYVAGLWLGGMLAAASIQRVYLAMMAVFPAGALLTLALIRGAPVGTRETFSPNVGFRGAWVVCWRQPGFCPGLSPSLGRPTGL